MRSSGPDGDRPSKTRQVSVAREAGKGWGRFLTLHRASRRPKEARKVTLYRVKRLCDLALAETTARFGVSSYGSVAWATHQVRTAVHPDVTKRRRVHRIEQELNQPKA